MSMKMMVKRERPVDALFHPKPAPVMAPPPPKIDKNDRRPVMPGR